VENSGPVFIYFFPCEFNWGPVLYNIIKISISYYISCHGCFELISMLMSDNLMRYVLLKSPLYLLEKIMRHKCCHNHLTLRFAIKVSTFCTIHPSSARQNWRLEPQAVDRNISTLGHCEENKRTLKYGVSSYMPGTM
jgi:hypothetical protein